MPKKVENTMVKTTIKSNGSKKLQKIPNTDLLYLIFISLFTISKSNGLYLIKFKKNLWLNLSLNIIVQI